VLYLISQILLWMLLALAAGLLLGWPLFGRRLRKQLDEAKKRSRKSLDSAREELAHTRSRMRQLEVQCDRLRDERMETDRQLLEAGHQANVLEGEAEKLRAELEASMIRVQSLTDLLAERDLRIRTHEDQIAVLERHVAKLQVELRRRDEEEAQSTQRRRRTASKRVLPEGEGGQLQIMEPPA
jgi:chromosome segregation ATPase